MKLWWWERGFFLLLFPSFYPPAVVGVTLAIFIGVVRIGFSGKLFALDLTC